MKKILILLSLVFLLTSCFNKEEQKITLDKENEKIIEEILNIDDDKQPKTEEQAIKEIEQKEENKKVNKEVKEIPEVKTKKLDKKDTTNTAKTGEVTKEENNPNKEETDNKEETKEEISNDILDIFLDTEDYVTETEKEIKNDN